MAQLGSLQDNDKQSFVLDPNADVARRVVVTNTPNVTLSNSITGAVTFITRSVTVQTALAANANRKGFLLWNDTAANCFIRFEAGASTTTFSVRLPTNQGYESPGALLYTGIVTVVWASGSTGVLLVTEFT